MPRVATSCDVHRITSSEGKKGVCQMESAARTIAVAETDVVEKLRGQLMAALSLLMSLGFDALDLRDLFLM